MLQKKIISQPRLVSEEIKNLFIKYGDEDYDGEPVSQASHMIQCAMLAMGEGEVELTIGAFLHDIGHLLKHERTRVRVSNRGASRHKIASFVATTQCHSAAASACGI